MCYLFIRFRCTNTNSFFFWKKRKKNKLKQQINNIDIEQEEKQNENNQLDYELKKNKYSIKQKENFELDNHLELMKKKQNTIWFLFKVFNLSLITNISGVCFAIL